ncbi:MAG: (E)-4-hydroxy-3-methylbut-2-enyl-diphosphate synthase, partial [Muribaculaceae bacterium]|nr:(E)-4-hydroxy-3-methylbut-2-enyl-diphosphate synthase [Muribaculaceae bacterium]
MTKKTAPRRQPHTVMVGDVPVGGNHPVAIQSMTNTPTLDTEASAAQVAAIAGAGAPIVRLTAQGVAHARNLRAIRERLDSMGVKVALVADIHFNPAAAFEAALHVDKVRINPGNFVDPGRVFKIIEYTDEEYRAELERLRTAFTSFLDLCRANGRAIRIGVNHGSLSDRIMSRYGDTPAGMVESAMEFLRVARDEKFDDIVISIKASNVTVMVETVRLLCKTMAGEGMDFPVHLGVTEAGDGEDGRVKSAVGIGTLLAEGIGDTIRVSLSEAPEAEVSVARMLLDHIERLNAGFDAVTIVTDGAGLQADAETPRPYVVGHDVDGYVSGTRLARAVYPADMDADRVTIAASVDLGRLLLDDPTIDGIEIVAPSVAPERLVSLAMTILQATRRRITKTEYIACPGCG